MRIKKFISFIFLTLLSILPLKANNGFIPVVTNFSSLDYNGGLQNWSIAQDDRGTMYFGNNIGLLSFDGYSWDIDKLPGDITCRSVLTDDKRIYVGSYEEFGYFERDDYGNHIYKSLWNGLKGYKPHNDEIWNIIKDKNGHILFQSFCSWFEYDGKRVKAHYNPNKLPLYFFKINESIYVQLIDGDFCKLNNGQYHTILKREELKNDNVVAAFKYKQNSIILCTEFHGLFILDSQNKIHHFQTDIDDKLYSSQVNRAIITNDGKNIIIGTILGGVFGLSLNGKTEWHYDTSNMLRNNTVLNLFCDYEDNIWVALDTGLAIIHRKSPYTLLKGPFGMVFDLCYTNKSLYIASNQNALLYNNGTFSNILGTQGQNWHITLLDRQIIVGNNHGTRIINGTNSKSLSEKNNSSSTAIRRYFVREDKDYLIEASYAELRIYKKINGNWIFQNNVKGFMAPIRQLEIDSHGTIWAASMALGCYCIELSPDMRSISNVRYIKSLDNSLIGTPIHIMKIRGEVIFSNNKGLYTVNSNKQFSAFKELNKIIHEKIISATAVDYNNFWLSSSNGYHLISYNNGKYTQKIYLPAKFFGLECSDILNNVKVFDDVAYFCLNGGIGRLDMRTHIKSPTRNSTLKIRKAFYTDKRNKIHLIKINSNEERVHGDVTFKLSYPNYNNKPLQFVFRLKGSGNDISSVSNVPEIQYNSLSYGNYIFTCNVCDLNGAILGTINYKFKYPLPFFLSYPMIFIYITALFGLIFLIIRWNTKRVLKRHIQKAESERIRQELKISEKQRIIEEQKKQLLEQQLQDKGCEIAAMAMDAVKNHDGNDEEYWNLFRENFDLIHKQFFRHLRERYPSLTATDLKFCAYLRLNLNTKDIAKYTSLSVRGVESARYRLRKKLQLEEGEDLAAFLIDFK